MLKVCLKLLLNLIRKEQQQSKPETSENCSAYLFMLELLTFHSTGFSTGIILCQHNRIIKTNIGWHGHKPVEILLLQPWTGVPTQQAICFKGRITNNWFLCFEQNRWPCSNIVLIGVLGFKVFNRILCRQIEVSWKETSIWNLPNY